MGIPQTHQVAPHLTYLCTPQSTPIWGEKKDVHMSSVVIQKQDGITSMLYPEECNQVGVL